MGATPHSTKQETSEVEKAAAMGAAPSSGQSAPARPGNETHRSLTGQRSNDGPVPEAGYAVLPLVHEAREQFIQQM